MRSLRIMLVGVLLMGSGCAAAPAPKAGDGACKTDAGLACHDMSDQNKGGQNSGGIHGGSGGGMGM
jgi:hypothetical protein